MALELNFGLDESCDYESSDDEDRDDRGDVISKHPSPKVPDPKQNEFYMIVMCVGIMMLVTTLVLHVLPFITWYMAYCKGFISGLWKAWKAWRRHTKTIVPDKSCLTLAFRFTKPLSIPCVALYFFGKTRERKISSVFTLVILLPTFNADITTMFLYILFATSIVKYHKSKWMHFLLGLSMLDNTVNLSWSHVFQAAVSYWYLAKDNDKSWVELYTNMIALFLEKMGSNARQKMGCFSTQDVFKYLQHLMGFGVREIKYCEKTKEMGYQTRGRGPAPSLGARRKSPGRST